MKRKLHWHTTVKILAELFRKSSARDMATNNQLWEVTVSAQTPVIVPITPLAGQCEE